MKEILIISDSLGETADRVFRAAVSQFDLSGASLELNIRSISYIRSREAVQNIFKNIDYSNTMIVFTTVIVEVRDTIIEICEKHNIIYYNIMSPIIDRLQDFLEIKPTRMPGSSYVMDENYFDRIDAIEFAVKYDDGKDLKGLAKADVVLIGISRTSKTPLSMYLSHKTVKVANVPLVPEIPVPKEIYEVDKKKLIGLTNTPDKLFEIRAARLKAMGLSGSSDYASTTRIRDEIKFAEKIYVQLGCPIINVAERAIEETANIIMEITGLNYR